MKKSLFLTFLAVLLWCGVAFSANGTAYYNLTIIQTGFSYGFMAGDSMMVLTQDAVPCTDNTWSLSFNNAVYQADGSGKIGTYAWSPWGVNFAQSGTCLASKADTPANLYNMIKTHWVDVSGSRSLTLGTDIDLGEISATQGKCSANHVPLPFRLNVTFDGNGKTVSNLCYVGSRMTKPVGFFETIDTALLKGLKMSNVYISIEGGSSLGADYYPVGSVAGVAVLSTVENVVISDVSINAPLAGGVAGIVNNTTLKNITGDDDIVVSNSQKITSGYAGSEYVVLNTPYNVFLGGIAGVAIRTNKDPTLQDDSIKVEVRDLASGHRSTLGGAVGMLYASIESMENVKVYTKVKVGETLPSMISGGSAMGGLVGFASVYYNEYGTPMPEYIDEDNAPTPGRVSIIRSSFDGVIGEARSPDMITVGGLVGRDSSIARMSVVIDQSSANVNILDSIETAGNYRYYVGGILGYGNNCVSSTKVDDFVSIFDSKASGNIRVAASAKAVKDLHMQTYMGGIAGATCLAMGEHGLDRDTASVIITSDVKTAADTKNSPNTNISFDTLSIGGFLGSANIASGTESLTLSNLLFTGKIVINDSLNHVRAGGVIGAYTEAEGGKPISFENIVANAEGNMLINYNTAASSKPATTNVKKTMIGGVCGYCRELALIENVGLTGIISAIGAFAGDELLVGGLVGANYSTATNQTIAKTYTIGDVTAVTVAGPSDIVKVGYLMGSDSIFSTATFNSNYHFGKNESAGPIGVLYTGNDETAGWAANDAFHYTMRNGDEKKYTDVHHNGTELAANMQKSSFAGLMNGAFAGTDEDPYAWTFVMGKNSNLPFFADAKNMFVKPNSTTHIVTFVDAEDNTIVQREVADGGAAEPPAETEMPEIEGYTFAGTWDVAFDNVLEDLTVKADYVINSYEVKFLGFAESLIGEVQIVEHGSAAVAPEAPARTGYAFVGWDDSSYVEVKSALEVNAVYVAIRYEVNFVDFDGAELGKDSVAYGKIASVPVGIKRPATAEYTYTFIGWNPEVAAIEGDVTYEAVYDSIKVKYEVVFLTPEGAQIGDAQMVEYGSAAVPPEAPSREGYVFVGWTAGGKSVTENAKVYAVYETAPASSSSSVEEPESSSSEPESSSSSSAKDPESSSSEPKSSSSYEFVKNMIVAPKVEQSGNAIRLDFGLENVVADTRTEVRVVVTGEYGVIADTVLVDSLSEVSGHGLWEMIPAPMGKFEVKLIVANDYVSDSFTGEFEIASAIEVQPRSWQMVSLAALKSDDVDWGRDASFYWWDETNPIGDYWQYRAFEGGEIDATRGFWYGTSEGKPLVLREATGAVNSEILWQLDSLYSGWNLVANPYGWYVDLSNAKTDDGSEFTFWYFDPEAGYRIPSVIGPYQAVWVKATSNTTMRVSAAPTFTFADVETDMAKKGALALGKSAGKTLGKASAKNWTLLPTLVDVNGKRDAWNMIGAGSDVETLDEPPTSMGDRVSLSMLDGNKKLAKFVKAAADEYEWTLSLSANGNRDALLSFEGLENLEALGLTLSVTVDGKSSELKAGESVKVSLAKSAKKATVRVAPAAKAVAAGAANRLRDLRLVQSNGGLQMQFNAAENLAGAAARYTLVGVNGKMVASGNFTAAAGVNSIAVNVPKAGVYFMQLKVASQMSAVKVMVK